MVHTILMIQPDDEPETKTYADFESVNACMEGICKIYEETLKKLYPNSGSIAYDMIQLFEFIDDLNDISCLVFQSSTRTYAPYTKRMIKEKIYLFLRRQADLR